MLSVEKLNKILWGIVLLSALFSIFPILKRHRIEKANHRVEVALDYDDFLGLCDQEGLPVHETLEQFRQAGVTSIALSGSTLDKLHKAGRLLWIRGEDLPLYHKSIQAKIPHPSVILFVKDKKLKERLGRIFASFLAPAAYHEFSEEFVLRGDWEDLSQLELGIDQDEAEKLAGMGFLIDPRLKNRGDISRKQVDFLLSSIPPDAKPSVLIFAGLRNEVLGFDHDIGETAKNLRQDGLRFGYIEVYEESRVQKGSESLSSQVPDQLVKVQGLILPPLSRIDPESAVETFSLGVKERNVRLVYFRPFLINYGGMSVLKTNLDFLASLRETLERGGFRLGKADVFPLFGPNRFNLVFSAIGTTAALFLLILFFFEIPVASVCAVFALVTLVTLIFSLRSSGANGSMANLESLWLSILAFVAANVFPTLAIVTAASASRRPFHKAVLVLLGATALTLMGGFFVSAFLANNLTMLGIVQFRGVKAILLFPVVFSTWFSWVLLRKKEKGENAKEVFWRLWSPLENPARLYHLAGILVVAAGGAMLLLRSGNTMAAFVPGWEKSLRVFLETVFVARPRFKEFAIGHPFFLLAASFGIEQGWGLLLLFIGSLGQADIMDSFAHLHTPLHVTMLRTFHALWLGIIIGGILFIFARKLFPRELE